MRKRVNISEQWMSALQDQLKELSVLNLDPILPMYTDSVLRLNAINHQNGYVECILTINVTFDALLIPKAS